MTVPLPAPEWPALLRQEGPPEDRSILLRAEVSIGRTRFTLTAIRVDPIRFGPDFRPDQSLSVYADYQLPGLLDIVAELVGTEEPSTLQLDDSLYVLWMLPSPDTA